MRRTRGAVRAVVGATALSAGMVVLAPVAQATTIPVACGENALIAAVNLANSTVNSDTLTLAGGCTYALTSPHGGPANGLPVITTPIELLGPATITRTALLPFRIAEVGPTGSLTLTTSVAFTNGSAAGNGGAILNRGAVTLTGSSLSGNQATLAGGGLANADTPSGTAPAATFTRSDVLGNTAGLQGGGIYNGLRATLTTSGVTGGPMLISANSAAQGGGIAAVDSTATTLTQTAVTVNHSVLPAGGIYRANGTMTTNNTPITANTPGNCAGSTPAVPHCTG
ncbi:hypothetical protein L3Q67_35200 [Saccharothrix sp. AJ9571]|nr:hypothetical protein L3Q67_35200 [Saccharothrix sp. AJ9571]